MALFGQNDDARVLDAIHKSQAVITFDLNGVIQSANQNFCKALGYEESEIVGKHHRIFVDPTYAESQAYKDFWIKLSSGEFDRAQYKRFGKGGREIWIEASYNPVFKGGKPYKVVKIATDITATKLASLEDRGKIEAISRAQAVIEFTPSGDILNANDNFLKTLGYTIGEVKGRHHSMFCEHDYVGSTDYREFWRRLGTGQYISDEFLRIGKGGKRVHIQATYNPIFDADGNVFKVVKFATDVTERVQNVEALGQILQQVSEGDLEHRIEQKFMPALEPVRRDVNNAIGKLRAALLAVGQNAHAIAAGSSQIRTAADDLSKRTEQQAASVEETAAALEEITTTVSDSARRAEEAGRLVATTRESAERSGEVVNNAIQAMGAIEKSSREIANIIGVIDEIAFQTNLLALNAGVEAARAGDAGKGFAVVAQEVRELAQRSANAAKEIKSLISTSNEQVKSGVNLVGQTGEVLSQIVDQVRHISSNVNAIVEGAKEQSTGLREINNAVNTMDQGTQQNAAMVEESTAASHSLAKEAEGLFALIGQFRLGQSGSSDLHPVKANAGGPVSSGPHSMPVASPANTIRSRISNAFRTQGGAAVASNEWEEF